MVGYYRGSVSYMEFSRKAFAARGLLFFRKMEIMKEGCERKAESKNELGEGLPSCRMVAYNLR